MDLRISANNCSKRSLISGISWYVIIILAAAVFFSLSSKTSFGITIEEEGYEISRKSHNKQRNFKDEYTMSTLKLIDSSGNEVERTTVNLTLERENSCDYLLIQFLNPADVRGTSLLTYQNSEGDDSQWLYFPEIKRIKRLSTSDKSGSFMGSEFSYEDITGNTLNKWRYKKIKEETIEGIEYYVIEKYPNYSNSRYSKVQNWITKKDFLLKRSEMFDKKNCLLKVQTFSGWKEYSNTWRPSEIKMENLQNDKKSILTFKDRRFSLALSEKSFQKSSMKNLYEKRP